MIKNRYQNIVPCKCVVFYATILPSRVYSFFQTLDDDLCVMLDDVEGMPILDTKYINASYLDV